MVYRWIRKPEATICIPLFLALALAISCGASATATPLGPTAIPATGKIAFVSNRDGQDNIYIMNADGSGLTRLTFDFTRLSTPSWTPDKGRFDPGVTPDPTPEVLHPSWSPDGSRIAFVSSLDGTAKIYVMNADGSGQTRLTNISGIDSSPVWSPDGKHITFSREAEIYIINADGTGLTNLTNNPASDRGPVWMPTQQE